MSGVSIGKVHLFVGWVIFHFHDYIWEKGSTVGGGFFPWTPSETYHWSFTIPNAPIPSASSSGMGFRYLDTFLQGIWSTRVASITHTKNEHVG